MRGGRRRARCCQGLRIASVTPQVCWLWFAQHRRGMRRGPSVMRDIQLTRLDDYPVHQTSEPLSYLATSERNVYGRYWFNGYDPGGDFYFGIAFGVVGSAMACFHSATEYAKTRIMFGRPIGQFQAVKHRCADMAVRANIEFGLKFQAVTFRDLIAI